MKCIQRKKKKVLLKTENVKQRLNIMKLIIMKKLEKIILDKSFIRVHHLLQLLLLILTTYLGQVKCYSQGIKINSSNIDRIIIKTEQYLRTSTAPGYPRYYFDYFNSEDKTTTVVKNISDINMICSELAKFQNVKGTNYIHPQGKDPIRPCDYPYPFNDENVDCFTDNMYISLKMEVYMNNFKNIVVIYGNKSRVCYKNQVFKATKKFQNLIIQYESQKTKK